MINTNMQQNKITPTLWYHTLDGTSKHVTEYYAAVFGDNFSSETPTPLGETPSGYAEMCTIRFFGNTYMMMTTAKPHQPFNDSFAMMIHCNDQEEIDTYWNFFVREGKPSMCGWCNDKFGLRWQIVPKNMGELMSKPNAGQVMYKQSKIIIAEYLI